jgi:hypothetical protein
MDGTAIHTMLEERLLAEKRQCDMDLRSFLVSTLEPMMKQHDGAEFQVAAARLHKLVEKMMNADHPTLRGPKGCTRIVSKIRSIQASWQPRWPGKGNLTKLLLIISRVARVVAQVPP